MIRLVSIINKCLSGERENDASQITCFVMSLETKFIGLVIKRFSFEAMIFLYLKLMMTEKRVIQYGSCQDEIIR